MKSYSYYTGALFTTLLVLFILFTFRSFNGRLLADNSSVPQIYQGHVFVSPPSIINVTARRSVVSYGGDSVITGNLATLLPSRLERHHCPFDTADPPRYRFGIWV